MTWPDRSRAMGRHAVLTHWHGRQLVDELAEGGILIRCRSSRGVAEEAPGACKDVDAVVDAAHVAGQPRITVKG